MTALPPAGPQGHPSLPLTGRDWWIALGLAGVVLLLGSWQMVAGVCGVFHDDAIYVITAKALSEGQGYRLINLPHAPLQTKYPILYPAFLALIWKMWPTFPDNLPFMQWLTLLCGAATMGVAYLYMVRWGYFGRGVAGSAALLSATSPIFLYFCGVTLSEIPFALLVVLAAWALDRHLAGTAPGRWSQFSLGLLLALPFLTRSIGIVFAPTALGLLYFSHRSVRWVMLGAASLMLPWIILMLIGPRWNDLQVNNYYTNYLSWWSIFGITALGNVLLSNLFFVLHHSIYLGLGILNVHLFFPSFASFLIVFAGIVLYFRLLKQLIQGRVLPSFLAAYLLITLIWPWPPSRFLVPILPFLLAYFLHWLWDQLSRPAFVSRTPTWGALLLCLVLACNLILVHRVAAASRTMHYPVFNRLEQPLSWSSFEEIFAWLKTHTQPHDVIASGLDTMIFLYTHRRAVRPFVGRPVSLFYGGKSPPLGSVDEMVGIIRSYKARYLVHTPMPFFGEEKPLEEFVRRVQQLYPGWLKPVHVGTDQRFVVFELRAEHGPQLQGKSREP